jgi:hypothetical protein
MMAEFSAALKAVREMAGARFVPAATAATSRMLPENTLRTDAVAARPDAPQAVTANRRLNPARILPVFNLWRMRRG